MSILHHDPALFSDGDLSATLRYYEGKLSEEVEGYDANALLNTPVEDLCGYFEEKFRIEPIALLEQEISTDQYETTVDIRDDPYRRIPHALGPTEFPATALSFFLPFSGDPALFRLKPNFFTSCPPQAQIRGNELVFTFVSRNPDGNAVRAEFDAQLRNVKLYVSHSTPLLAAFNGSIAAAAKRAIESRRDRLLKASNTQAALGFRMRRRQGVPETFAVPSVKRKLAPSPPVASTAAYTPEPALDMENYEHILSVVQNMALVLERSPSTFKDLDEEAIRQHFLVQLNGHYEGTATGETFNGAGKTDILIRHNGKNIFIAECKFWKGPAKLTESIDQLLSYTSWRDTKTALFVFVRDTALSTVLAKMPEVVKAHPSFKREQKIAGETQFRAIFGQPKDPSRELFLTTVVFDIPH